MWKTSNKINLVNDRSAGEQEEANMAYCPNCGEQVRATDIFCRRCRYSLSHHNGDDRLVPPSRGNTNVPNVKRTCPICRQTEGTDPRKFGFSNCPVCHGRRFNLVPQNMPECRNCGGEGIIRSKGFRIFGDSDRICEICEGTGYFWNR